MKKDNKMKRTFPDSISELIEETISAMQVSKMELEETINDIEESIEESEQSIDENNEALIDYKERLGALEYLIEEYNDEAEDLGI